MLDSDLAKLYGVSTKVLNQAVRRNLERFPDYFMFTLTPVEAQSLRSQFVTLEPSGRGAHRKYLPPAFTQGVAMLSGVLHSPQAVQVNIAIIRAFISIRQVSERYEALGADEKLAELERQVSRQTSKSHRQSRPHQCDF